MAGPVIRNLGGAMVDFTRIAALNRVVATQTANGTMGAFDMHLDGTIYAFSGLQLQPVVALWQEAYAQWTQVVSNVRQYQVGPTTEPLDVFALALDNLALVGAVQVLPVVELHVHQRAIVPFQLNGSTLNADYATQIAAEEGREAVIQDWASQAQGLAAPPG